MKENRESWGSRIGFLLAAAGSAIGLGNLWKFPYLTAKYGGGAFVFVYLVLLFVIAIPLVISEIALGKKGRANAITSVKNINKKWSFVGWISIFTGFVLLSFYSVIGGWVINYIVEGILGNLNTADTALLGDVFGGLVSSTTKALLYHGIFMMLTVVIVVKGISGGIEKAAKIMMPALFGILILTVIRTLTLPGAMEGVKYYIMPDFSQINMEMIIAALGQLFFSVGIGMAIMITYGSYLNKDDEVVNASTQIAFMDTAAALIAGFAIIPAVFSIMPEVATNPEFLEKTVAGPSLIFITLPAVFSQMPFGQLFMVLFFILILFAALTSSISLLEVFVAYLVDEKNVGRTKASLLSGTFLFLLGGAASLSMGAWSWLKMGNYSFFDFLDGLTGKITMPIAGLVVAIFVGWIWGTKNAKDEITSNGKHPFGWFKLWEFFIKFIVPIAIAIITYQSIQAFVKGIM